VVPLHQLRNPGAVDEHAVPLRKGLKVARARRTRLDNVGKLGEEPLEAAGVITSIMRASPVPAFHMVCNSPRGLTM